METVTSSQVEEVARSPTSRDACPFVLRFPTEILEDIFLRCARECYYEHHHCVTSTVPCRVGISYVCRHWRDVVLACPMFWAYVFIASQRWTEELLARSKQASLKICANFLWKQDTSLLLIPLEKAMENMERVQELCLKLTASCREQERIVSMLSSRAPCLRNLEIMVRDERSLEWPPVLFQGDTPALRTLELCECPPLLHSFKLNAVTILDLFDVPHRFRPSMEEFLSTLRGLQNLKHLHLYRSLARATGVVPESSDKIDLPHLSRFSITTSISMVVAFFHRVNIPLKAKVKLGCECEPHWSFNDYDLLNSLLVERYNTTKDQKAFTPIVLSLSIDNSEWASASISFNAFARHPDSESDEFWHDDVVLEVDLGLCGSETDDEIVVSNVCRSMPLSDVRFLEVIEPPFSQTFWERILGYVEEVRCVKLKWGNMPDLSMLSSTIHLAKDESVQSQDTPAGGDDQARRHTFLPWLEELELVAVEFAVEGDPDPQEPAITRQRLFEILSKRQRAGLLAMTECEIGDVDVDLVMVWDGSGVCHVISEKVSLSDRREREDEIEEDYMDWMLGWDEEEEDEGLDDDDDDDELEDEDEEYEDEGELEHSDDD